MHTLQPITRGDGDLSAPLVSICLYFLAGSPLTENTESVSILKTERHCWNYSPIFHCQEGMCFIEKVPFRGAPCSDAAGTQKTYKWMMKQVNMSLSGRRWDDDAKAPYFNYKVSFHSYTFN